VVVIHPGLREEGLLLQHHHQQELGRRPAIHATVPAVYRIAFTLPINRFTLGTSAEAAVLRTILTLNP
jgi:hypothetical protein